MMSDPFLLIFGLGYCGRAVAARAMTAGYRVAGTTRAGLAGALPFAAAAPALAEATHLLITAAPEEGGGDPVLARYHAAIAAAPRLRWIGYLSSTGVYGDHAGALVEETTPPRPASPRSQRRLAAERAWEELAAKHAVDLFRLAGIYGPGRSVFDDLRAGRARRIIKPGQVFSRIHRDDIAGAVLTAMAQAPPPGTRVFNLADDEPSASAAVVAEGARLLGLPPPPEIPFVDAAPAMSAMARSFWAENRRVGNARTKAELGLAWRYPSYREGLAAILAAESGHESAEGAAQQSEISGPR
jgi:nucleoside-diphosphate-sugar epimerase